MEENHNVIKKRLQAQQIKLTIILQENDRITVLKGRCINKKIALYTQEENTVYRVFQKTGIPPSFKSLQELIRVESEGQITPENGVRD